MPENLFCFPATTQDVTITPEAGNVKLLKHTYK